MSSSSWPTFRASSRAPARARAWATTSSATWSAVPSWSTCSTAPPRTRPQPRADLAAIEHELTAYGDATGVDLVTRPRLIALNKIDVPAARERADQ